jgi:hypothetical protein
MFGLTLGTMVGNAEVSITSGRGLNADELTRMALSKIIFVGPEVPPAIRDQAEAYKARIESVLRHYLAQAQKSQNTTICNTLEQMGETQAAEIVRRL